MRDAVTRLIEDSDPSSQNYADDGDPRFFSLTFPWMFDDAFKAWAIHGLLVDVAHQVLTDAEAVMFFIDDLRQGTGRDQADALVRGLPFLPVKGDQQIRIWVLFDTVTKDGGAVHYLRGSHKWGNTHHPIGFKNIPIITDTYVNSPYEDMPLTRQAHLLEQPPAGGRGEPGDLLLHHPQPCTARWATSRTATGARSPSSTSATRPPGTRTWPTCSTTRA